MTFTTDRISNPVISSLEPIPAAMAAFKRLSTDDKLGVLWFIYDGMGGWVTPAATGAARLQFAEGLLEQVKALSASDQLTFMRDLVVQKNTPMTRAYGVLTNNTKLAFWYQLAELMQAGTVVGVPEYYRLSSAAAEVYQSIVALEFGQQITVLRKVAVNMGYDPFA
ncbi:MAG: orange carotenoid protein N-terminal domain-containing protein [Cyanobacteria bacterium J06632_22]